MKQTLRICVSACVVLIAIIWAINTPIFAPKFINEHPKIIAHRGVHQDFDRTGLTNTTCTAARTIHSEHDYLENTLPSMAAAFDLGAEIVEIDIHLTTDGELAIFHDWTLDCRTDGTGETRAASMTYLKTLDIGFGYTADDGETYPFRGKGIGMLPTLDEVMTRFPEKQFLIDIKSNDPEVGYALVARLQENLSWQTNVWSLYGGRKPVAVVNEALPNIQTFTARSVKNCLKKYLSLGWSGYMPEACRGATIYIPVNYARILWGWPNRLVARVEYHGGTVVLIGPHKRSNVGARGLDAPEQLERVPANFPGYIQTDKIEIMAPWLREHAR